MQKINTNIASVLDGFNVPYPMRGKLVCFAIARAMAYHLSLPSAPVGNPTMQYNDSHRGFVANVLSAINEVMVFDIDAAEDLTAKIWKMRYELVHNPAALTSVKLVDMVALCDNRDIAPAILEAAQYDESRALASLTSALSKDLKEIGV